MRLVLPILLVTTLVVAGCQKAPPPKVEIPRPVRTMVVQPESGEVALVLPGELRPRVEARYGFRVGGKIAERRVSVGDRVAPGTVIARLDPQDLAPAITAQQAQVQAARTDLKLAQTELARVKELRERQFIAQAQVDRQQAVTDAAVSRLESAEAQLKQARNAADFQVLTADVVGVVVAVEAEAGQVVAAGQTVVRIANTAEKEVLVNVPEPDLPVVRAARSWAVSVPALGVRPLQARLRELSPLSDPASRTYAMRLTLLGDTAGAELGMTAVVRALRVSEPAFVVPLVALHAKDKQPHVWVVDPAKNTVRAVPVTTAGLLDDSVRIVAGLNPGDRVVTAGANLLVAGQAVRIAEAVR